MYQTQNLNKNHESIQSLVDDDGDLLLLMLWLSTSSSPKSGKT